MVIGGSRLAAPGEDVEDHVGRVDALAQRLLAGGLDRGQAVAQNGGEDVDHLAVAIVGAGELAPDPLEPGRQHPVLERRAVPAAPRACGQAPARSARDRRSSGRARTQRGCSPTTRPSWRISIRSA